MGLLISFAGQLEAMLLSIGDDVSPMVALVDVCVLQLKLTQKNTQTKVSRLHDGAISHSLVHL